MILQHRLLHYRVALFARLRELCLRRGVTVDLVHGQSSPFEQTRADTDELPWAHTVRNRFLRIGGVDLVWQPFPHSLLGADLVVMMQENRLLSNYPWLFLPRGARTHVAYWGHGRNLQSNAPDGLRERWKRICLKRVDWWFAYTDATRDLLLEDGFPTERITVLNNAIDSKSFGEELSSVSDAELDTARARVGARADSTIALYCGSLWPDKRLDLLIEAADYICAQIPSFRLVVVGDGPSRAVLQAASQFRPWLVCIGSQRGRDRAVWFRVATAFLSPGAVGLNVLDAFCAGLPMITTLTARHGPEVTYLRNGVNSLVVDGNARALGEAFVALVRDSACYCRIREAARHDARTYSMPNMVERFADGIESCLAMPRWDK